MAKRCETDSPKVLARTAADARNNRQRTDMLDQGKIAYRQTSEESPLLNDLEWDAGETGRHNSDLNFNDVDSAIQSALNENSSRALNQP